MKRNKKILVIGSGFAGIACCLNLIENKYTPTLVDTGKSFKKDTTLNDLLSQKTNFFHKEKLYGIGGQSSVWAGIVHEYTKKELQEIICLNKRNNFYQKNILSKINSRILTKNYNVSVMIDSKTNKITRLNTIFKKLINEKKINYINSKVKKIYKKEKRLFVKFKNKTSEFDYAFLCCGAKSITKLLKNSHSNQSKIIYSQKFLIPTLINKKLKNIDFKYPLAQYSLKVKNQNEIYAQVYSLSQMIERFLNIKFLKKIDIFNKIGCIYLSVNSELSDHILLNDQKLVYNLKPTLIKKFSKKLFKTKKFSSKFTYLSFFYKMGTLSGNHYGGNLPFNKKKVKGFVNILCQPVENNRISILGSSIFKSISAVPPTLTIFFFSYFKTKEVIKKYF
jgi:hypothetical protein